MLAGENLQNIIDAVVTALAPRLERTVDERINAYRRAVYVRSEWCCNEMRSFAVKVWGASQPRTDEGWASVAYQLRGHNVNYCPFCGVSFGKPLEATTGVL